MAIRKLTQEQLNAIAEALGRKSTIDAIKLYREFTDAGLTEAKTAVDGLMVEYREKGTLSAESVQMSAAGEEQAGAGASSPSAKRAGGCASVLLVGAACVAACGWLVGCL